MAFRNLIPWNRGRTAPTRFSGGEESLHPMMALHRDIERVFDQFWNDFAPANIAREGFGFTTPAVDVSETDKALQVSAELPGLSEDDVDIQITGDTLTIRGEKKDEREEERKGTYVSERTYGSFYRAVPLPPGVDTDKAEASFENGVLTVNLPKSQEAQEQVKRIDVKKAS